MWKENNRRIIPMDNPDLKESANESESGQEKAVDELAQYFPEEMGSKEKESDTKSESLSNLDESTLKLLRQQVLVWTFTERFLEMVVVLPMTLLAINWTPLRQLVENNILLFNILMLSSILIWQLWRYIPYLKNKPGWYFFYLLTTVQMHILFALLYPQSLFVPYLSPYFAVLEASTQGLIYFLLSLLSSMKKVRPNGPSLYLCGMIMPILVFVISQLVYILALNDRPYKWLMINVAFGLIIALLFSYENIYCIKKFANSKFIEECAEGAGLVSLSDTGSLAALKYLQNYNEEENKKRDVGNA